VPPGVILGDAGYGIDTGFRTSLTSLALPYVLSSPAETGRCIRRSPVFGAARTGDGRTIEDQG
jgi:SRSO17 transposase